MSVFYREAVVRRCSLKMSSQKFRKIHKKTPLPESYTMPPATSLKKVALAHVFSCEFSWFFAKFLETSHFIEQVRGPLLTAIRFKT